MKLSTTLLILIVLFSLLNAGWGQNYRLGGYLYPVASDFSAILGGYNNSILGSADSSVILGGGGNQVSGAVSLAFGKGVNVSSDFVTVFYDSASPGKVGINEENPTANLHINGDTKVEEDLEVEGKVKINDVLRLTPRNTTPSPEEDGLIYYNEVTDSIYVYADGSWKRIAFE